jgi:hypothetical protein
MTSRERFLRTLKRETPDRLPVTTHHLMPSFLNSVMSGITDQEFFDTLGLDPILWLNPLKPDEGIGDYWIPAEAGPGIPGTPQIGSDAWRIRTRSLSGYRFRTDQVDFITPEKILTMVLQSDSKTTWVTRRLIQDKTDIELIERYAPVPLYDVEAINRQADSFGERGLVRGTAPMFPVYGQPGCWQDAAVLFGIENLIMETFDDPVWVHTFLSVLKDRKARSLRSLKGARLDILEHGGGDASSTVISPKIFETFIAPYDSELIGISREMGIASVYHTCGGMMPLLELIAGCGPDAMETFTPPGMGGDTDLREAKRRIGRRVCMIGGFDQFHFFSNCFPDETRKEVRRCFEEAGEGGGFILSPSDHFFEADIECLRAYADEARRCVYS